MLSNDTLITIAAAILAVGLVTYLARKIGRIAERRGRNFYPWAVFAFFLPIPAVVLVYLLPSKASDLGAITRHF